MSEVVDKSSTSKKNSSAKQQSARNATHDAQMRAQIARIALIGFFSLLTIIVLVMLLTPLTDVETGMKILSIVAAAGSGIVGTIVGYYFGKKE
jgi:nitric oxide reductase large subunit